MEGFSGNFYIWDKIIKTQTLAFTLIRDQLLLGVLLMDTSKI